jgi:hypothetical protein
LVDDPGKGWPQFLVVMGVTFGACGAFVTTVVALVLRPTARSAEQQLAAFRRGEYLAHWTYEPDEWRRFAEAEWAGARRAAWGPVVVALAFLAFLLSGLIWIKPEEGDALLLAIISALLVGFAAFAYGLVRFSGRASYQRAFRQVGETYLGPRGIYYNGMYHTWDSFGIGLKDIRLRAGNPTVLELTIGTAASGRPDFTLRALVPAGHEEEARRVVEAFGAAPD